jgi:ATP-dependent DNA ligase
MDEPRATVCADVSSHVAGWDGPALFRRACAVGLERIVSKRLDTLYQSAGSPTGKIKCPSYRRA